MVSKRRSAEGASGDLLKLNLGCGERKHEGYINIDFVAEPDLKLDLHDRLPYADGCVDEILAEHMIESFYKWEFLKIVKDWFRVLKPEGTLKIALAELGLSAKLFLSEDPDKSLLGRNGLFGEQKDPNQVHSLHKYAYTLHELADILRDTGFVDIVSCEDRSHGAPERDVLIVCKKPMSSPHATPDNFPGTKP